MSAKKALTLSIVIPVYNEESHLAACLEAIAAQTVKPDEVLVVDNNSTDRTVEIAKAYPFVALLTEAKQHQVFAQAKGFDAAKSAILARIDADTVMPPTWVADIKAQFKNHPDIIAVSGGGEPYDVPLKKIGSMLFWFYHETVSRVLSGHPILWGSNMAFLASTWPGLKQVMHMRADLWEDYDMSFHLAPMGKLRYDNSLRVKCSFRAAHKPIAHQVRYQYRALRTFSLHRPLPQTLVFGLVWSTVLLFFPLPFIDRNLWRWRQWRATHHLR